MKIFKLVSVLDIVIRIVFCTVFRNRVELAVIMMMTLMFNAELTYAVEMSVVGPCEPTPQLVVNVDLDENQSITLGDLTVTVLNENRIPFKGDRSGIAQIKDSPIGQDAIEIISSTQMRAYGWCVHIDQNEPAQMPNEVLINAKVRKIIWFYAYSLYDNGAWKDYCTPSWKLHSLSYCQSK